MYTIAGLLITVVLVLQYLWLRKLRERHNEMSERTCTSKMSLENQVCGLLRTVDTLAKEIKRLQKRVNGYRDVGPEMDRLNGIIDTHLAGSGDPRYFRRYVVKCVDCGLETVIDWPVSRDQPRRHERRTIHRWPDEPAWVDSVETATYRCSCGRTMRYQRR